MAKQYTTLPFPRKISHEDFQDLLRYLGRKLDAFFVYTSEMTHRIGMENGAKFDREFLLKARGRLFTGLVIKGEKELLETYFRARIEKEIGANLSALEIMTETFPDKILLLLIS